MADDDRVGSALARSALENFEHPESLSPLILLEVAKHLCGRCHQNCRLVCKQWREVFSLAVSCAHLCPGIDKKLQSSLHNMEHTFQRIVKLELLSEWTPKADHWAAIQQALANMQSLKELLIYGSNSRIHGVSVLQTLPSCIQTLHLRHDCFQSDLQELALLTFLTSLSLNLPYESSAEEATSDSTMQQLLDTLSSLAHLKKLHLSISDSDLDEDATQRWFTTLAIRLISEHPESFPTLQHVTLHEYHLQSTAHLMSCLVDAMKVHPCLDAFQLDIMLNSDDDVFTFTAEGASVRKLSIRAHIQEEPRTVTYLVNQYLTSTHLKVEPEELDMSLTSSRSDGAQLHVNMQLFPSVERLSVSRGLGPDQRIALVLFHNRHLARLEVDNAISTQEDCTMSLSGDVAVACPSLTSLSLTKCLATLQNLYLLTRLTSLHLSSGMRNTRELPKFNPEWLPASLRTLHIAAYEVRRCMTGHMPELSSLTQLKFTDGCNMVDTGSVLESFRIAAHSLQSLQLEDPHTYCDVKGFITGAAIAFPLLQQLVVGWGHDWRLPRKPSNGRPVTAYHLLRYLNLLKKMKHLHHLRLPIAVYNIEAIDCLASMTQLENLQVDILLDKDCDARECVGRILSGLPWLKTVNIRCEALADADVAQLKLMHENAWPNSHIIPDVRIAGFDVEHYEVER